MAKAFTVKSIEAMKPGEARREIPDPSLSGLYLVIQPSGAKSWALRYRFGGKPCKLTLGKLRPAEMAEGTAGFLGLAEARKAAGDALEKLELGRDPAALKKAAKAERAEAQLTERDKVKTLVKTYDKRHLSTLKSGKTVKRELERHVVSEWGDRDIHEITKRDILELLEGIADTGRGVTANRVRAYLKAFLAWCVNRDVIDRNPADGVKPPAKERARARVLSDDEIRWFWQACDAEGQPWGHMAKLLLLTGQRLGEVAKMTDGEIRGDLWHLREDRTKNGRAHDVPLSKPALDVLADVKRIVDSEGKVNFVFTTNGRSPVQSFDKPRNRLAVAMKEIAEKEAGGPVEIEPWGFHDLRRTCATGMAALGVPVRVTEAVLNHVSGTGGGIVGVYQRHDYATEKRDALSAWGGRVMGAAA
ncbi:integrase [Litorivita pollutaquae]|uniref:Integrase n=1 Tax=Litorivita pollutaquae TaxID=2200892 RepID=A0A2V4NTF9_9RHOB|nr:site-specific integrase [Litorivita pollutaquae]PYC48186.1 integrase [Litorivita pollutaquae]